GQVITMKDEKIRVDIEVNKVDSVTKENIKSKDFKFTMYSDPECKEVLVVVNGDTETGIATFKGITYGTFYIKETSAPQGYKLSDEVKKVIIDENTPVVDGVYSFQYVNVLLPVIQIQTGVMENPTIYLAGLGIAAGIIIGIMKRKKK
ncbi:prealbumin-like fold domain-containing protein, partial [Amedibacterium intestinale]|uniref:prealbumin-like fold domain-containing protein n=2 Tax=Erysipelotrichaceae TaxID=128827 RepID=UPI0022E0A9F2